VPCPRKLLNDGEQLVLDLRPHWIFLAPSVAGLVISIGLGLTVIIGIGGDGNVKNGLSILTGLFVLAMLGWFVVRYAKWVSTQFVLTGDRVISRRGVLSKSGMEIPLERINTVVFSQRILERLVGAGDIGIESASEGGRETFTDIRRPAQVQREIYVQMENNSGRDYRRMGTATADSINAGAAGTAVPVAHQLEKLDELRRNGVLSEAEFQAQKARLLEG
jgi:uncharacterized membrane protein YdbT with pleckstrin-like domain